MEQPRIVSDRRALHLGLFRANDLLAAPLSPDVEQAVRRDAHTIKLAQQAKWQLFEGSLEVVKSWNETFFPLQLTDHWQERLTYLRRLWLQKHGSAKLAPHDLPS